MHRSKGMVIAFWIATALFCMENQPKELQAA